MTEPCQATSPDGTAIAYQVTGAGSPVLLVGGAFNDHTSMTALADLLAEQHTVVTYDRRGRGGSEPGPDLTDDQARAAAEIADAHAVLADATTRLCPGAADAGWQVFGHSSGAVLALRLATEGEAPERVARVTAYEPTWIVPGTRPVPAASYRNEIRDAVARGDRDAVVRGFLETSALVPSEMVDQMAASPAWGMTTALAHTIPNDLALHTPDWQPPHPARPTDARVTVLVGGNSPEWFHATAASVAEHWGGELVVVEGQDHNVLWQPQALLPYLA